MRKKKETIKIGFLRTYTIIFCMLLSVGIYAQNRQITGNVYDERNEAVISASIVQKGTTKGTVTDLDGHFELDVPENAILVISYLGFKSQEIPVAGKRNLRIVLVEDSQLLDELVVIGYGSVKKNDATGSVVAIKPDEMNRGLTTSPQDLLTGKIAGVSVISNSGQPGAGATIRIRGGSSLSASNDPLIIIDGVIMDNKILGGATNPLNTVNPNDIETFTVLKDASATAIYGSRASNGVIMITTKKGVEGKPVRVTYDGNFSIGTKRNKIDVLSGDEFRDYIKTTYSDRPEIIGLLGNANTDWQDEIYRTVYNTDQNVSIFGSIKDYLPYRASVGYTKQDGILETTYMDRTTASISLTPSLFDKHLNFNINGKYVYIKNRFADGGAIGSAASFDPTQPVKNGSMWGGYFTWTDATGKLTSVAGKNPVAMLAMREDKSTVDNFIGNIQVDYKLHFFPDLKLNLNIGMNKTNTDGNNYNDPYRPNNYAINDNISGSRNIYEAHMDNKFLDLYAQYVKTVDNIKSTFDVMAGYSWQHNQRDNNGDTYYVSKVDKSNLESTGTPTDFFTEYYLLSYFGRFNYTLADKYLLTFTLRDDASSRFSEDNRWALFPSLALSWKISEESFLKNSTVLSNLKLRLGWGKTGQQDIMPDADNYMGDYPYIGSYQYGRGLAWVPMGKDANGNTIWSNLLRPNGYNSDIKWETTTTWNIGFDYGFLNNRINGAIDLYWRTTDDLINHEVKVVSGTNFSELIYSNIGSLENNGIEFSINAKPVLTKDFVWDLGFNIAYNKSKITELTRSSDPDYVGEFFGSTGGDGAEYCKIHAVGQAPGTFYVYEQIYGENGKPIEGAYVDRNNDGTIDDGDRYFYKKPTADVLIGFSSKFTYKAWDFGFNGRASIGNYNYNAMDANSASLSGIAYGSADGSFLSNVRKSALETNFATKKTLSDYYIQNASFLKIDNITLGYSFQDLFKTKLSGRVYTAVQNPIVITKYSGLDPEVTAGGNDAGIDNNLYPRPITFIIGLNLNF